MVSLSLPSAPHNRGDFADWFEDNAHVLADWLELTAFTDGECAAYVGELVGALDLGWDSEAKEIHTHDQLLDDIAAIVAAEIDERVHSLRSAYPFQIAPDGSVLRLSAECSNGGTTYLLCLVLSHVTQSSIVPSDLAPSGPEVADARNTLFECCATLAAAGICKGPAFRLGALRRGAGGLLEKLAEIWGFFGDGKVRSQPLPDAPRHVNDAGIDVISWEPSPDGRAGTWYLLGQAASGNDWVGKDISSGDVNTFHRDWFDPGPGSTPNTATFVPFRIPNDLNRLSIKYGRIVDRLRLPYFVDLALLAADQGIEHIECLASLGDLRAWVSRHRDHMKHVVTA